MNTTTTNRNNLKELRSNIEKRNGEKYLKNLNSRYKMAEKMDRYATDKRYAEAISKRMSDENEQRKKLKELRGSKNKSFYKKAVITGRATLNRALMAGDKARNNAIDLINKAKKAVLSTGSKARSDVYSTGRKAKNTAMDLINKAKNTFGKKKK